MSQILLYLGSSEPIAIDGTERTAESLKNALNSGSSFTIRGKVNNQTMNITVNGAAVQWWALGGDGIAYDPFVMS